jgi:hypothetical protein
MKYDRNLWSPMSDADWEKLQKQLTAEYQPFQLKIFSHDAWDKLLDETILQIKSLSTTKGAEYAHGNDRLDNFRRNGLEMGLPMETIWRVYALKHWDSITTYIKDITKGTTRPRSEPISGRVDDLIVYLLLLKAMLKERGEP